MNKALSIKHKKTLGLFAGLILATCYLILSSASPALAGPFSTNYQIIDYGFGSGGTVNSYSTNYAIQGTTGEIEMASMSSSNYMVWPGLTYTLQPSVPPAPTLTNPSNAYYNKLHIIINQGIDNSTDVTYAIEVSTDNFVNDIKYVQADQTLGVSPVWQSYTSWNSSTGIDIIGLTPGTTYYARVAASRGTFTQGSYGPGANAATTNPTFTYSLQTSTQANPPLTVGIGVINAGQVTTSWQKIIATITTNAYNGGTVYVYDANSGLSSAQTSHTISSTQNDLSSGGVSEGYGARAVSVSQDSGTMEIISPYNGADNNVGPLDTEKRPLADSSSAPVTNGQVNFELKAKAASTTFAASDYSDVVTVVASGSF
jgi:hypothetical protein